MGKQMGCKHSQIEKAAEHQKPAAAVCNQCGQVFEVDELIELVASKNSELKNILAYSGSV